MKTTTFSGMLAIIMIAIFTTTGVNAQISHSLDSTGSIISTTTADSLKFAHVLTSAHLPAYVQIKFSQSPISAGGYQAPSNLFFAITDTVGSKSFSLSGLAAGDTCFVNYSLNGYGSSPIINADAPSDMQIVTLGPPQITSQPGAQTINLGQSATLTCSASGSPTYQWYSGSTSSTVTTLISGATDSFLVVTPSANTYYKCIATNSFGSSPTNSALVTVNQPPVITSEPVSVTVNPGQTATLSVSATGLGLSYKCRRVSDWADMGSASTFSWTVSDPLLDTLTVVWIVTNGAGSDTSQPATIGVNILPPTLTQNGITVSSITLTGGTPNIPYNGNGLPALVYILSGTSPTNLVDSFPYPNAGAGSSTLSIPVTGYSSCSDVYFKVVADNSYTAPVQTGVLNFTTALANPSGSVSQSTTVTQSFIAGSFNWNSNGSCSDATVSAVIKVGTSPMNLNLQVIPMTLGIGSGTAVPFTVTGLSANTTYYIQIVLKNQSGPEIPLNMITATTDQTPMVYSVQINSLDAYQSMQGPVVEFTLTSNVSTDFRTKAGLDPNLGLGSVVSNWQTFGAVSGMSIVIPLVGLSPGTNYVTVQYKGLATNYNIMTTDTIPILILGVGEVEGNNDVKVFPNPAIDFVTIVTQDEENLTLSNILGEVVMEKVLVPGVNKLEVIQLPPGLYFYKVGKNSGKVIIK